MRNRLLGCLAVFLIGGGLIAFFHRHTEISIGPSQITLPADGAEHEAFQTHVASTSSSGLLRMIEDHPGTWYGLVKAPVTPGTVQAQLHWRYRSVTVPINFVFDANDSYSDGTPDFLRLHTAQDRRAFRFWFTSIAEGQVQLAAARLAPEINDCAALLRYAYREALHTHDENWLNAHATEASRPSVQQYTYPQTPLGANLFRVRQGPFSRADIGDGSFAQFADARTLMEHNTYLIGRDVRLAQPGDLIFYRQLEQVSPYDVPGARRNAPRYHSPYHSMIVCGGKGEFVVYHTGPIHNGKGEMRRLLVSDLLHHPDPRWRPLNENANFLGVYRWNILREGD